MSRRQKIIEVKSPFPLSRPLVLGAAQVRVSLEDYASEESFRAMVERTLKPFVSLVNKNEDALLAFPEDLGLGLALTSDFESIRTCKTLAEAGRAIALRHAYSIAMIVSRYRVPLVRALLIRMSPSIKAVYQATFESLSRQHGIYLMSGSAPLAHRSDVFNEGFLWNPEGRIVASTRKVQLVPLEKEAGLNLCASDPGGIEIASLPFGKVAAPICFDVFHPEIVDSLAQQGVHLLLQPSFNPFPWTPEQASEWQTGLWEAVQRHKGLLGVNPMMVGELMDVKGEGRSSIVTHASLTPDGSGVLAQAPDATGETLLAIRLLPS